MSTFDMNAAADEFDEQENEQFNTLFNGLKNQLASATRKRVIAIESDTTLSNDEKLQQLRAEVIVATADRSTKERAAQALTQSRPLTLDATPTADPAPTSAPQPTADSPKEPSADAMRVKELEKGFEELARFFGSTVVSTAGKIDVTATVNAIKAANAKMVSETKKPVTPEDMVLKSDVRAAHKRLEEALGKKTEQYNRKTRVNDQVFTPVDYNEVGNASDAIEVMVKP